MGCLLYPIIPKKKPCAENWLVRSNMIGTIVGIETVDHPTNGQLVAHARKALPTGLVSVAT